MGDKRFKGVKHPIVWIILSVLMGVAWVVDGVANSKPKTMKSGSCPTESTTSIKGL